ncbi:MAG TPA: hypothetical protein VHK01_05440 [Lacipirellulaceae bacterium]|nr:hypothetical protein [Lacipirellulaceae bacterium]
MAAAAAAAPKTIVLQDGGVLVGNVSLVGERYVVTTMGSEIRVAPANVLVICESLDEAYELRREKIARPDAAAHLALADWCLRYNLVSQATRELADARRLDPLHPRVGLLERRLAAAATSPTQSARPRSSPAADRVTPAAGSAVINAAPIDALPEGALEQFTRKVQPILVNNCTVSGCHQPGGRQNFQLDRSLLHGLGNRRTTMRNLAATLALIDREQPQLSPLLTVPRETHGGMDRPIIGPRQQAAFEHLVDWVALITNIDNDFEQAAQPYHAPELATYDEATMATVAQANTSVSSDEAKSAIVEKNASTRPMPIQFGAQLQPWQPKDPFDPEIFNRARPIRTERKEVQQQETTPSDGAE